jgi:uncharacterized damage-inducible protein DinB
MEINRIAHILKHVYEGEAWHGPSIKEVLTGVDTALALKRLSPTTHNIAELVIHMSNWRVFALEKLTGSLTYDIILNSEADWQVVNELSPERWQELLEILDDSQNELLEVVSRFSPNKINDIVPGRRYSFYILLHGIIQHDIYHSGQIAQIKKA